MPGYVKSEGSVNERSGIMIAWLAGETWYGELRAAFGGGEENGVHLLLVRLNPFP